MLEEKLAFLKDEIIANNQVDAAMYEKYDVKRGLRNKDGSGVLAGLTNISSVVGAKHVDWQMTPIEGELTYRGVSLLDLIGQFDRNSRFCFEKIAFLMMVGRLPDEAEFDTFKSAFCANRALPQSIIDHAILGLPGKDIMNKLQTVVSALYTLDEDPDSLDPFENFYKSIKILAKAPLILAYSYLAANKENPKFVIPDPEMSTAEAFLYALGEGKAPTQLEAHILDLCLVLHAEHGGGNNSTFTTYVVTSSGTDIYCAIAAAIASLKGPLHGAANRKARAMFEDIMEHLDDLTDVGQLQAYVRKILNKEAFDKSGKIYGLGHAVYTKSDPRAVALKPLAMDLAKEKGREDEYQLYLNLEIEGPKLFEEFKGTGKVISPNVDFFSGFVYDCLNIPRDLFTPLFAAARISGWCAHRIEEIISGKRIIRPGYKYVGT